MPVFRAFWKTSVSAAVVAALHVSSALAQSPDNWIEQQVGGWYQMARKMAPGRWGIAIADPQGNLLWSVNPDSNFVPASTVKLLTTGFSRSVVGSDAHVATRIRGAGSIDATGAWIGNWQLELNGDVTLERVPGTGPSLRDLAAQLRAAGIRTLRGPLVLTSENGACDAVYPAAWSPKHKGRSFAPLVGPLMFHENIVLVGLTPGSKAGSRAVLTHVAPHGLESMITVRATTRAGRRSRLYLSPRSDGGWVVSGTIGSRVRGRTLVATMTQPAKVLEAVWAQALADEGIRWDRTAQPQPSALPPRVLAEVQSPSFDTVASEVNRRSLNSGAELMLQWAAGRTDGPSRLTAHVGSITGMPDAVELVDGSGLSYKNRATPRLFTTYLSKFPTTPAGRGFPQLLPANGSGTLHQLASGLPASGVVRAKTGTLQDVSNVVGYLGRPNGVLLVALFYEGPRASRARQAQWRLFRVLGADGVMLPADTFAVEEQSLGGDSLATKEPAPQ